MTCTRKNGTKGMNKKASVLTDSRDLVRFITVLLFVPWFGWITEGIFGFEAEFEVEVAVLASFFIFGSFWCGWICPFGNVSYFVSRIGRRIFPNLQIEVPERVDGVLRNLKYLFLAVFVFVIVTQGIDYFFGDHMVMYKSTFFTSFYISSKKYFVLLVPLLIPRFFCKYLCFQKGAYNIINRFLSFTAVKRDVDACIGCRRCDRVCPMEIKVSELKTISGRDCIGCYNCVDSGTCPDTVSALGLWFLGKKVNPLLFGIGAVVVYYAATYVVIQLVF